MVSLSMIKNRAIPVNLPAAATGAPQERQDSATITITAKGGDLFQQAAGRSARSSTPISSRCSRRNPDAKVFISGDTKAEFGQAIECSIRRGRLGITQDRHRDAAETPRRESRVGHGGRGRRCSATRCCFSVFAWKPPPCRCPRQIPAVDVDLVAGRARAGSGPRPKLPRRRLHRNLRRPSHRLRRSLNPRPHPSRNRFRRQATAARTGGASRTGESRAPTSSGAQGGRGGRCARWSRQPRSSAFQSQATVSARGPPARAARPGYAGGAGRGRWAGDWCERQAQLGISDAGQRRRPRSPALDVRAGAGGRPARRLARRCAGEFLPGAITPRSVSGWR